MTEIHIFLFAFFPLFFCFPIFFPNMSGTLQYHQKKLYTAAREQKLVKDMVHITLPTLTWGDKRT